MQRTLYKFDTRGQLRVWWAEVSGCGTQYRTHAGLQSGGIVESAWTQCRGNQQRPSAVDQCAFEVAALYAHRLARTYHVSPEAAKGGAAFFEVMLAQTYKASDFRPGDLVQAKYDGGRGVGSSSGLTTRNGKQWLSAPHIVEAIEKMLEREPDFMGDGELYGYGLPRQRIMSLIRKTKHITADDIAQSAQHVRWYLYDLPSMGHLTNLERYRILMQYTVDHPDLFAGPECELAPDHRPFIVVPTYSVQTPSQYAAFHASCVARKLEGSIYRRADGLYENKRSKFLLKRKDFDEDEFEVLGVNEGDGNWAGCAKTLTCRALPLSAPDYGPQNPLYHKMFYPTTTGSMAENTDVLLRSLAGETPHSATVKYFDLSQDGVPQHCNVTDVWWEPRDI